MKYLKVTYDNGIEERLPCNKINQAMSLLSAIKQVLTQRQITKAYLDTYEMYREIYLLNTFGSYKEIISRLNHTKDQIFDSMCEYKRRDNNPPMGLAYQYLYEIKIAIESNN